MDKLDELKVIRDVAEKAYLAALEDYTQARIHYEDELERRYPNSRLVYDVT